MHRLLAATAAIMIGVLMSQGCNKAAPESTGQAIKSAAEPLASTTQPAASLDPVEALRKLVRSEKLGNHVRAAKPDGEYEVEAWIEPKSVKLDVQKTDSLVSPLVGVITLDVMEFGVYEGGKKLGETHGSKLEFRFNYVDGQWVPQEKFRLVEILPLIGLSDDWHSKTHWLIKDRPWLLKVLDDGLEKW